MVPAEIRTAVHRIEQCGEPTAADSTVAAVHFFNRTFTAFKINDQYSEIFTDHSNTSLISSRS